MYLKKLELVGFKSFAHKTILEFDRGIVSIVGPNGSGKSNVADAVRWVLGEQSIKLLRGKRSEDVIFSGSSIKAKLGMAEVSLHLDNSDHKMPVDYSDVVITRRIYRNGEGEYFLNKNNVRLQDIHLLLAKSDFGQKSYSVIGQGMIDHVLVASPAERKIFFDEAAGVRQFQIKREQAVNKMEQTKENLGQAQMVLQEIEPRLRTLTRQVRRLERRGAIEQELQTIHVHYFGQRLDELQTLHKKQEATSVEQTERHQEKEKALAVIQQELETLERERSREDLFHELQQKYSRVLEQKNTILKEQVVLEGTEELEAAKSGQYNLVWLENRERELTRSLEELKSEQESITKEIERDKKILSERTKKQSEVLSELAKLEKTFAQTKEAAASEGTGLPALEQDFLVLHEEFATFHKEVLAAENERSWKKIKQEVVRLNDRLDGLRFRFQQAKKMAQPADILRWQDDLTNFFKTKDTLVNEIHELTTRIERREERRSVLEESRVRLDEEAERARRERERLSPVKGKESARKQHHDLNAQIQAYDKELQSLREQIVNFNKQEQKKKERLFELQKTFRVLQSELNAITAQLNATRVEVAKLETKRDDLLREMQAELPPAIVESVTAKPEESFHKTEPLEKLQAEINRLKHQMELIGGIDETVTSEFKEADERYNFLSAQVSDLTASIESLHQIIAELDETIKKQFRESFAAINKEFGKYFKALFDGGAAKLILLETELVTAEEDEMDEDEEEEEEEKPAPVKKGKKEKIVSGVEIIAQPEGKRVTSINMLSGGERALTSIALICAIISTRPSPFVVLDEVDAALDEANSQRFAAILKNLSHKTQFITITHNRATMHNSSLLYGVTMSDDGVSKLLSIKMEEAERAIAQHGNR